MIDPADWARAFARQADADFRAWDLYQVYPDAIAEECHTLLFLQMACEKLCKAHRMLAGAAPESLLKSHAHIAKALPDIIREQILFLGEDPGRKKEMLKDVKYIANEIELLNPAVDRDDRRPDNCEYPWEAGDTIVSPLDWPFYPSSLLTLPSGRDFVTLLRGAISRVLEEAL